VPRLTVRFIDVGSALPNYQELPDLTKTSPSAATHGINAGRRILRWIGRALGVLLLVIVAALALILHDLDARVRAALVAQAAELELSIGRAVTLGAVHVTVGRTAEIVVSDVGIAGAAGATGALAEPLLRVPTLRLGVRLAPLVRSWGRSIEITGFEIEGPEITLVRTREGLSIDDVRARVAAAPARPVSTSRSRIALDRLAITAAKLHLRAADGGPGEELDVDPITLRGADIRPDAASRITLTAASAPGATLTIDLDFAPEESDPGGGASSLRKAEIHAAGVRLTPILAWLRARSTPSIDLADAELGLDVAVTPGAPALVLGKVTVARARFAATSAAGERALGAPMDLSLGLDATVDSARGVLLARSFDLGIGGATAHGTIEIDGLDGAPVIAAVKLDAAGDAATILAALPPGTAPRRVALAGPITLALRGSDHAFFTNGTIELAIPEVRLIDVDAAGHEERGEPAAVKLRGEVFFAKDTRRVHVSDVELRVGEAVAWAALRAHDLATGPEIDALTIESSGLTDHLLALAPPSHRRAGVALRGPFSAKLTAHGKPGDFAGQIAVDLDRASVRAPGLEKPAGARLGVDLEGSLGAVADLTRGSLRVGPLSLAAHGKVWSGDHLDLTFAFPEAALGPLLALFPEAGARLTGATVEGKLSGSGTLRRGGGTTELATKLRLGSALLRRGPLALLGAPEITAAVVTTGNKVSATIEADLGAATVAAAPVFSKAAGRPARLAFTVTREGDHASLLDAHVALPGLTLDGLTVGVEPHLAKVSVAAATIALGPLAEMFPLFAAYVPPKLAGATARFTVDFSGDPADLASATLHVGGLAIESGMGRLAGAIDVDGLAPLRAVRVAITDGALDLGALDGAEDAPFEAPIAAAISARVHLDTVRARGATLHPVDAELDLARGRLTVKSLHAGAFGGSVDVEKSWIDLAGAPELDLHARIDAVDLAQLGAPAEAELRGRASAQIDLHGAGEGRDAVLGSLHGTARLGLRDVHGRHAFTRKVTVVNPILGEIFARAAAKSAGTTRVIDLREASALFAVGSSRLTTTDPILVRSDDLTASVRGTIGFDQTLALDGQLTIAPRAIAAATDGELVPVRPIPLQVRVAGAPRTLQIEILELAESVLALRGAVRNGLLGGVAAPLP
jgi:AsmA-like protein